MKPKQLVREKTAKVKAQQDNVVRRGYYAGMEQCKLAIWAEYTDRGIKMGHKEAN